MDSIDARTKIKANLGNGTFEAVAMALGGYVPPAGSGAFGYAVWCHCLKIDQVTLRRRIKDLAIPHRKHGQDILMTPEDYLQSQPYVE